MTGPVSVAVVVWAAAGEFDVRVADILGPSRQQPVALARQTAMLVARRLTGLSYPVLGRLLGGRDHTTVLHGVRRTQEMMSQDPELELRVARVFGAVIGQTVLPQGLSDSDAVGQSDGSPGLPCQLSDISG